MPDPVFDELAVARDSIYAEPVETATDGYAGEPTDDADGFNLDEFLQADEGDLSGVDVYELSENIGESLAPVVQQAVADQLGQYLPAQPEPTLDDYLGDPYDPNFNNNLAAVIGAANEHTLAQVQEYVGPLVQAQEYQTQVEADRLVSDALDQVDVGGEFDKALATDLFNVYKTVAVAEHGVSEQALHVAAEMAAARARDAMGVGGSVQPEAPALEAGAPATPQPYERGSIADEMSIVNSPRWQAPLKNVDRRPAANPGARQRAFEAVRAERRGR